VVKIISDIDPILPPPSANSNDRQDTAKQKTPAFDRICAKKFKRNGASQACLSGVNHEHFATGVVCLESWI